MNQFENKLIQVLLENEKGKREKKAQDPHAEKVKPGVQPKRGPKGSQSSDMNWLSARMEGHPSGSQARLKRELGDTAYEKLSSRPNDPSPVEAAKRRGSEFSKEDLEHYKARPSRKSAKAKLPADLRAAAKLGMNLSIRKPKKAGTRASKKTQAAIERAKNKEADAQTQQYTRGSIRQQRGK